MYRKIKEIVVIVLVVVIIVNLLGTLFSSPSEHHKRHNLHVQGPFEPSDRNQDDAVVAQEQQPANPVKRDDPVDLDEDDQVVAHVKLPANQARKDDPADPDGDDGIILGGPVEKAAGEVEVVKHHNGANQDGNGGDAPPQRRPVGIAQPPGGDPNDHQMNKDHNEDDDLAVIPLQPESIINQKSPDIKPNKPINPLLSQKSNAKAIVRNCTEKHDVYMLKIQKSGSTTLQNILWRLGFSRDLRMMIFPNGYPYPFRKYHESYAPPTDPKFDGFHNIMSEHSIYYPPAIQATMPKTTVKISLVRNPLSQLKSAAAYYNTLYDLVGVSKNSSLSTVMKTFLKNPMKYEPKLVPDDQYKVRNHVANMFGFEDWKYYDNPTEFDKFLRRKDDEFSLVLILERLPESLVLLRRYMCWSTKDILMLHTRQSSVQDDADDDSIEDLEMEYRAYNPPDYYVYDFFFRKLGWRIDDELNDFQGEVKWFRQVLDKTEKFCRSLCTRLNQHKNRDGLKSAVGQTLTIESSQWEDSFTVDGSDCLMMMFDPYLYRNAVKVINYPQLCEPGKGGDKMDKRWKLPPIFCKKDFFKYTIPWDSLLDPSQYVYPCIQ